MKMALFRHVSLWYDLIVIMRKIAHGGNSGLTPAKAEESMDTQKHSKLPGIGMRNVKTAFAAALCAFVYYFLNRSPAFACIGAIFGMGSDLASSKQHGGNRLFGTLIGGLLGIALFWVYVQVHPDGEDSLLLVLLTFVGVIILIWLCQVFWVGGVQPGGVVLCIILFNTPVESYVSYALNRIFDTAVGVVAALIINSIFPGGFTFRFLETNIRRWREDREELVER